MDVDTFVNKDKEFYAATSGFIIRSFPRALTACRQSFSGGTSYSAETLAKDDKVRLRQDFSEWKERQKREHNES